MATRAGSWSRQNTSWPASATVAAKRAASGAEVEDPEGLLAEQPVDGRGREAGASPVARAATGAGGGGHGLNGSRARSRASVGAPA